jgi:hypothetical protein
MNLRQHNNRRRNLLANALVALVALTVAFAGAAALAPIVIGQEPGDHIADDGGPVTARRVVASGTDARFGRWHLVISQDKNGELCRGVRFLDADALPGLPELSEGCGGQQINDHVATITSAEANRGTFIYGRVAPQVNTVTITNNGQIKKAAKAFKGNDGNNYVIASIDEAISEPEITASDANARALGRIDPGS